MKIGFVVTDLFQMGGVERVVLLLSRIFCEQLHHEVTIFSCLSRPGQGKLFFECPDKVKIVHLSENLDPDSWLVKNSFSQKTFLKFRVLSELKKYQKDHPHDILISTVCWCNCFVPFFARNAKTIACEHGSFSAVPLPYRWASRLFFRFSDAAVFLTAGNAENYTFVRQNKKFVIPNPLSFMPEQSSDCSAKRMISLTRFTHEKGNDMLLMIAAKLKNIIPDWRIDVFGAGADEELIKEQAEKLDLGGFLYFNTPTANAQAELLQSSLYILYSRSEGLPMVLLEAQTCGVPAISFACGHGPGAIINDNTDGLLVPPNDTDAFVQAVVKLANDEDLRRRFGSAAKINSQRFAPEKIAEIWQQLFDRLMQS